MGSDEGTVIVRFRDLPVGSRRAFLVGAVVVSLPFVVAALAAHHTGWFPVGDDATQLAGVKQVFTAHPPLVGQADSSVNYGVLSYNLGPLVFYLYAPFVRLLGDTTGMLAAAACIKVVSLVLIGYVVLRIQGLRRAFGAWAVVLAVATSLGGVSYLYDPFYSVVLILPLFLFLVLCLAMAAGWVRVLPLFVGLVSLVLQCSTQFTLVVLLPAVAVAADLERQRWIRRRRYVLAERRLGTRLTALTVVVGLVAWLPTAADAVAHGGGNVRDLARGIRAAGRATTPVGAGRAVRYAAQALLFRPARTGLVRAGSIELVLAAAVTVAGAALVVARWRRMTRLERRLVVLAAAAAVSSVATVTAAPDDGFQFTRLVVLSISAGFAWFAAWCVLLPDGWVGRVRSLATGRSTPVWGGAAAALAVLAVSVSVPLPVDRGKQYSAWTFDAVREMGPHVRAALHEAAPSSDRTDGAWLGDFVGPRSMYVTTFGLRAYLDGHGVPSNTYRPTGVGWSIERDGFGPTLGRYLVMPDVGQPPLPAPWKRVAAYRPAGRDKAAADAVAAEAVAYAARTRAVLTTAAEQGVPSQLCPQVIAGQPCTEAQVAQLPARVRAALCLVPCPDNRSAAPVRIADLPRWGAALVYVDSFDRDYPFPSVVGPAPSASLLRRLRSLWIQIPVVVYARTVG